MFDSLFLFFSSLFASLILFKPISEAQVNEVVWNLMLFLNVRKKGGKCFFSLLYSCTKLTTYTFSPLFIDLMMTMNVYDRID